MIDFCNKHNFLVVGRGATGIYLILKTHFIEKKVLLPANICYAAVYPVIYSGNIPIFCDVDFANGNVNLNNILPYINDISAMIIPHMYGNPVSDIKKIAELCRDKGILLIEDCASAMGAKINGTMVGSHGDYVVYSTGYSKTLDLGNGGIIMSEFSLEEEKKIYQDLPLYNQKIQEKNLFFSQAYRKFRNSGMKLEDSDFIRIVNSDLSSNYLYRLSNSFEREIHEHIEKIDSVVEERRYKIRLYNQLLRFDNRIITNYIFSPFSVPWRKNILVNSSYRGKIVKQLLNEKVPVSDWYPVTTNLFGDTQNYPNAKKMENTILNFPLLIPDEEIIRIVTAINQIVETIEEN